MLKLGDKTISKLYLGDKAISKAYLGEKLVFQSGKPIFLDYVEFDGKSYIDTGIMPTNETGAYTRLSTVANADTVVLGCRESLSTNTRCFLCSNAWGSPSIGWGLYKYISKEGQLVASSGFTIKQNIFYEQYTNYLNNRKVRIIENTSSLDVTTVDLETLSFTPTLSMFLGCLNAGGTARTYFTGSVSQCTITEGNTIVRDLRPCIDPKGTVCFYDTITKKYFYNQGTGTLGYTE